MNFSFTQAFGGTFIGIALLTVPVISAWAQESETIINEIAPLDYIIPEISPMEIIYEGDTVEADPQTVTQLRGMALQLRRGDAKIILTAYSGNLNMPHKQALRLSFLRTMLLRNALINQGAPAAMVDVKSYGTSNNAQMNNRIFITTITP